MGLAALDYLEIFKHMYRFIFLNRKSVYYLKISDELEVLEELREILCCPGVRALLQVQIYIYSLVFYKNKCSDKDLGSET